LKKIWYNNIMTAINFPDTPEVGDTFSVGQITWEWTGSVWKGFTDTSANVTVSTTPPDDTGSIWFNSENGFTYIYYDSYWTSIASSSGSQIISDTAPTSPVVGMQWFNSSTGKSYLYYSNAWIEVDSNGNSASSSGNVIINGGFDIWQRGAGPFTSETYTADRWITQFSGAVGAVSRQAFAPGQTDVPGNPTFFLRFAVSTGDNAARIEQRLEDVTVSSGRTYTLSFWAKGTNPSSGAIEIFSRQEFGLGAGGSPGVALSQGTVVLTGFWKRFTKTFTFDSVAGKTISSPSQFWGFDIRQPSADTGTAAWTMDIANVQLEEGTVATPFRRNGANIQAELAACQRYYWRLSQGANFRPYGNGLAGTTTASDILINHPTMMRVPPYSIEFSNIFLSDKVNGYVVTSCTINHAGENKTLLDVQVASGLTAFRPYNLLNNGNVSPVGHFALNAEL
jgi:hypothetical protein